VDGKGSIKELFPTGKQLEPLVAPLADGKWLWVRMISPWCSMRRGSAHRNVP